MILRGVLRVAPLLLAPLGPAACSDKAEPGDSAPPAETAETGEETPFFACTGLEDAIGPLPERNTGVTLFNPSATCDLGIWTFQARTLMADVVADEVMVMSWSASTGVFGPATALVGDGEGTFSGELPSSEVGFSCDASLDSGFVFAPFFEGELGVISGMRGRGLSVGGGWGHLSGRDYGFEFATSGEEVVSSTAVACDVVTGVGWGPYAMGSVGPDEAYSGAWTWRVLIPLEASGLGDEDRILLGGLGVDAEGELVASFFGGG